MSEWKSKRTIVMAPIREILPSKVSVLVVIGVTKNGQKQVIGIQSGDKESASSWRETFKDLKRRGLNSQTITLGLMACQDSRKYSERNFPKERDKGVRFTSHVTFWLRFLKN